MKGEELMKEKLFCCVWGYVEFEYVEMWGD